MRWAMLTTQPAVPKMDLTAGDASGMLLIDVREPEEYVHGHIPGAINVPQADLATRLLAVSLPLPSATPAR